MKVKKTHCNHSCFCFKSCVHYLFINQPQHTNVCFWYIPPSLRSLPEGEERRERLHKVTTIPRYVQIFAANIWCFYSFTFIIIHFGSTRTTHYKDQKVAVDSEANHRFPKQVAPKIKAMMMESGTTMVGYQPQGNKVNFFRMVISNPAATRSDIDFLIEEIERLGQDL